MTEQELRALDARIDRTLFGREPASEEWSWHRLANGDREQRPIAHYSTDIAAAFTVVEKMRERMTFGLDWLGFDGEEWRCIFAWTKAEHDTRAPFASAAATAPLAICLAALQAVEAER